MIVDFQMHYTPSELLKGDRNAVSVQLDEHGNPSYLLNPLLTDLPAHVRVMDRPVSPRACCRAAPVSTSPISASAA